MDRERGFFAALFDLSFSEFVTTRVIRVLYIIAIVVVALGMIGIILSGFAQGVSNGIVLLIVSPIVFLLYVLVVRIWLEVILVIFRIEENTRARE
ncbi:MAG: DUF4282 domain-containing protein [Phycisphaerae bacterium]|nr:DUF4282 domain-containing protein [Phycisphaerae bacterium]